MGYAFISYSSTDREFVTRVAEALKRAPVEVWFDQWNITGREPYWDEIQTGIEGASHFIFVISPDSISQTSGARKELYHASGLKSPPTIIPIMGRETPFEKLPILISPGEFQIHDFVHEPFDVALQKVLNAIRAVQTDTVGRRAALLHMTGALPAVKASQPVAPTQVPPDRPRRSGLLVIAAIVVVLLAIGLVVLLSNQPPASVAQDSTAAVTITPFIAVAAPLNTDIPTASAATATLPPVAPVVATGAAAEAAATTDIILTYDPDQVIIMNIGKRHLNVSKLDFVQSGPATRSLGASPWNQSNRGFNSDSMPPSACLQVAKSGAKIPLRPPACGPNFSWTPVQAAHWFWIAQNDSTTTFDVQLDARTIKTCQIKDGQCGFALP